MAPTDEDFFSPPEDFLSPAEDFELPESLPDVVLDDPFAAALSEPADPLSEDDPFEPFAELLAGTVLEALRLSVR